MDKVITRNLLRSFYNKIKDSLGVATDQEINSILDGIDFNSAPTSLAPGAYDNAGNLITSWQQMIDKRYVYVDEGTDMQGSNGDRETSFSNAYKIVVDPAIQYMGDAAIYNFNRLEEIILSPSLIKLYGASPIGNCPSLTHVDFPENLKKIDCAHLFDGCQNVTEIYIPSGVDYIGQLAFSGANNLATIHYSGTATGAPWGATNATIVP